MKKILFKLFTVGTIATPIITLLGCGNDGTTQKEYVVTAKAIADRFAAERVSSKKLSIIVSDPENPRWQKSKSELQKAGEAIGFATQSNIVKSQTAQNAWISTQLEANPAPNVLIVGATNNGISQVFPTALNKGTQVIAYDRLISSVTNIYQWYVTFDNSEVGKLQGLRLIQGIYGAENPFANAVTMETYIKANALSEIKTILMIAGDPADNNATLFFEGAKTIIDKAIAAQNTNVAQRNKLRIVGPTEFNAIAQPGWSYAKGKTFFDTQIGKLEDKSQLSGILSPNDGMATGAAIPALRGAGLDPKNIYITGQDSNDSSIISIFNQTGQDMTIYKPDAKAARIAVAMAAQLTKKSTSTLAEMSAYLKRAYPNIRFRTTDSEYFADGASKAHPIKSIILEPLVIDKTTLNTFFTVTKK